MPRERKNPYQQEAQPVPGSRAQAPKPGRSALSANLMRLGAIGTDFALTVAVSGILGWLADLALGTRPWALMAALILGIIAGFYRFVRDAMAENRRAMQRKE